MSIMKHVTLQTIVAHDFRYDPRMYQAADVSNLLKFGTAPLLDGFLTFLYIVVVTNISVLEYGTVRLPAVPGINDLVKRCAILHKNGEVNCTAAKA